MTLQDLGNVGEFIGAVAVVASLVYLALQVRSNTNAVRASTFLGLTNGWMDYIFFASQQEIGDLLIRAHSQPDSLSPSELSRIYLVTRGQLRRFENDYYQFRSGIFDADTWRGYRNSLREDFLSVPLVRALWTLQRDMFSAEFAALVDREAEAARAGAKSKYVDLDVQKLMDLLREENA